MLYAAVTLPHEIDGSRVRVNLTDWAPERDFNVTSVRPWGATCQVYELMPWAMTAEEACAEVPLELRPLVQAAMELYFGAPQTAERLEASTQAAEFCSHTGMFAMARFHVQDEPQYDYLREAFANARWQENADFPATLPESLAACLYRWELE